MNREKIPLTVRCSLLTVHCSLFPVTLPGLALLLIALIMLVRSLSARNVYETLLSSAALILLLILGISGAWAAKRLAAVEPQWKPPFPLTAASEEEWFLSYPAFRLKRFYRLHFLVRGRFFAQGTGLQGTSSLKGSAVFAETSLPRGSDTAGLRLRFPLGGLFRGEASCRLRDIFGFFSFPCGLPSRQALKIRSAPCDAKTLRIEALSGAEDRRSKSSSDEERYYMREYAPGDRLRDINWKSSERIDTLITRISPDNQEKVTRIEVCFRNYGPSRPAIGELWLLDRAKARLAWFLRSVKDEKASFVFNIRFAGGSRDLLNGEEINAFTEELSSLPFSPAQNEESPAGTGELYVFSTACDTGLPAFLLAQQGRPLTLFLAQNLPSGIPGIKSGGEKPPDCARLYLRDFPAGGFVPFPRWFLPQRKRIINTGGDRVLIDYAETVW